MRLEIWRYTVCAYQLSLLSLHWLSIASYIHQWEQSTCLTRQTNCFISSPLTQTWKKFGDAEHDNPKGPDQATTVIADEVYLTLTTNREVSILATSGSAVYFLSAYAYCRVYTALY